MVGDGEAETGALAASWHGDKFINPVRDGVVLPILHLNGYKIGGPTVLGRVSRQELENLFRGYGYTPYFVEGEEPMAMHQAMAATLDDALDEIEQIRSRAAQAARAGKPVECPRWPMIVLRTPKGWTGPAEVDGKQVAGTARSHQVPLGQMHTKPEHIALLEKWMKSCLLYTSPSPRD